MITANRPWGISQKASRKQLLINPPGNYGNFSFFGSSWGTDYKNKKFQIEKLHISSKKGSLSGPIGIREGQKIYVCKSWQYGYQMKGLDEYSQNMYLTISYLTPEALGKGSKGVKMVTSTTILRRSLHIWTL